ncbi:hypothetical protein [Curtobacterium flaccumfaciens]|uniref:hypothetical protein n=1 Tax=Curtobacterium flaccumfaciens TaxID=2035 RepID=UPI003991DF75
MIEWSQRSGEDIETVLGVMLCRDHPRAIRVRPSVGDFGIDVIYPSEKHDKLQDVVQIKRFASNLDPGQKRQIRHSLARLMLAIVRRKEQVARWILMMPLNPTNENRDWFQSLPAEALQFLKDDADTLLTATEATAIESWIAAPTTSFDWAGLDQCVEMAARYPDVEDYYLRDGKDRLRAALGDMTSLLKGLDPSDDDSETAVITPGEIGDHLGRLSKLLQTDPHFRYGIELSPPGHQPSIDPVPGMVAAQQRSTPDGGTVTVRVFTLFDDALPERPIPIAVQFRFESEADSRAFEDWRQFGKPYEGPASVDARLPGGLGVISQDARIVITPANENNYLLRYRIRRPDGSTTPALLFQMTSTVGPDGKGSWATGTTAGGHVRLDSTIRADGPISTNWQMDPLTGLKAVELADAVAFAAALTSPNTLEVSRDVGPFHPFAPIESDAAALPVSFSRFVSSLAALQDYLSEPVLIPDVSTVTPEQARAVIRAGDLVCGEELKGTWDGTRFTPDPERAGSPTDIDEGVEYAVRTQMPVMATINGREVRIGACEIVRDSARRNPDAEYVQFLPFRTNTVSTRFIAGSDPAADGQVGLRLVGS